MDYKKGNIVDGVVTGITSYGIFVKIVETKHGFETLKKQLPIWIHKSLKSKKIMNCVDKHEY